MTLRYLLRRSHCMAGVSLNSYAGRCLMARAKLSSCGVRCSHLTSMANLSSCPVFHKENYGKGKSELPPNSINAPHTETLFTSKWKWITAVITVIAPVLSGLASIVYVRSDWNGRVSVSHHIEQCALKLVKSTIPALNVAFEVHRKELERKIVKGANQSNFWTTVVVGPRGNGKSTVVQAALQDMPPGVVLASSVATVDGSVRHILDRLHLDMKSLGKSEDSAQNFLLHVLEAIKKEGNKPPIIVIDVDDRWSSRELEKLLLLAKGWGSSMKLAHFVVVISGAVSSYEIGISFGELRCYVLQVGEATEEDAREYFKLAFSELTNKERKAQFNDSEVDRLVSSAVKHEWRSFLHFSEMQDDEVSDNATVADIEKKMESLNNSLFVTYEAAVCHFLQRLGIVNRQCKGFKVFERIVNGDNIKDGDVSSELGMTLGEFKKACHEIRPHPVYIDITTSHVRIESSIMLKIFKTILSGMK